MRKCVFLDRDGTLCRDFGYNNDVNRLQILDGVGYGLSILKRAGFLLIVVSNQSCVARGICSENDVINFNNRLNEILNSYYGVEIDGFYFCPHLSDGIVEKYSIKCNCRKPEPGMIFKAKGDFDIDLKNSYIIGDTPVDVECGKRAGLKGSFMVRERFSFLDVVKTILEEENYEDEETF